MTQIGRMFEQEKQDAVNQAVNEATQFADAKRLVDDVESIAAGFDISIDEVCKKIGIDRAKYDRAKEMTAPATVAAAV